VHHPTATPPRQEKLVLEFSDGEIYAKAEFLGLNDGPRVPPSARSRVVAALVEERRAGAAQPSDDGPYIGGHITIRPGVRIELDGQALPAAAEPIEVRVSADPAVPSTVRLTLLAHTVQTIKEQ
jgi:hypothetical protein